MNRNRYRLIFDKRTGTLIPVAEFTTSAKKGSGGSGQGDGMGETTAPRWRRLAAMMALGMSVPLTVGAQNVVIDPSSGATVTQTANGVPLFNIEDANASGLSHNKALDFNVGPGGLVFNNSRTDGVSQIGGFAQRNPHLTREADGILVEVTGAHRSDLLGAMEVFGGKADLLIANENGLHVNGVSLINVDRATLTTGRYTGQGREFEVHDGAIDLQGKGLSTHGLTHADLVARSMRLHGDIAGSDHADLQLVAGLNTFDAATGAVAKHAGAGAPASEPLEFAIDASAVAMYGRNISMVSTESGLGVRHEGVVSAVHDIAISADGDLRVRAFQAGNQVTLSGDDVSLGATDGGRGLSSLVNRNLRVDARGDLQLNGNHEAGNFWLHADGTLTSNGTVQAPNRTPDIGGSIVAQAGTLLLTGDAAWQASDEARAAAGTILLAEGATVRGTDVALTASGTLDNAGVVVGSQGLHVGAELLVNSGTLAGTRVALDAKRLHNSGLVEGAESLDVVLGAGESTNNGVLTAGGALTLRGLQAALVNRGELSSDALLVVDAQALANHEGALVWANDVAMRLGRLDNTGTVYAGTLGITADWLRNAGVNAFLYAVESASLDIARDLDNTDGATLSAGNTLTIDADGNLRNGNGAVIGAVALTARVGGDFDNTDDAEVDAFSADIDVAGNLRNSGDANLHAGTLSAQVAGDLDNTDGGVIRGGKVDIDVDGRLRNEAEVLAHVDLAIEADTLDNAGLIYGYDADVATHGALVNRAGARVEAYDTLTAKVGGALDNSGSISAYDIDAAVSGDLVNRDGGVIYGERFLDATVRGDFSNRGAGSIVTGAFVDVDVTGNAENIDGALMRATYELSLTAARLANRNAELSAAGGGVDANGNPLSSVFLTTTDGDLVNAGNILAQGTVWIDAEGNLHNEAGAQVAGRDVVIAAAGDLKNDATARIDALRMVDAEVDGSLFNDGSITGEGVLLQADAAIRNTGSIVGGSWIEADTTALHNATGARIEAKEDVYLSTDTFANTGKIHSDGFTTLTIKNGLDLTINDSAQGPTGNTMLILNADDVTIDRELVNRGHIEINAEGHIDNNAGIITGGSLYATAGGDQANDVIEGAPGLGGTGNFTNRSLIWAAGDVQITADALTNVAGAEIEATEHMLLDVDGVLTNEAGARIAAGGSAQIDAQELRNEVTSSGGIAVVGEERGNSSYTRNVNLIRRDKYEVFIGQTYEGEFISRGAGLAVLGSSIRVTGQGVIETGGDLLLNQGAKKDKGATIRNQGQVVSGGNMFINGNVDNAGVAAYEDLGTFLNRPVHVELKVSSNILGAKETLTFDSLYAMLDHVYGERTANVSSGTRCRGSPVTSTSRWRPTRSRACSQS